MRRRGAALLDLAAVGSAFCRATQLLTPHDPTHFERIAARAATHPGTHTRPWIADRSRRHRTGLDAPGLAGLRKQPLAFSGLFAAFLFAIFALTLLPLIGSLLLLTCCRWARWASCSARATRCRGRLPLPRVFLEPLRRGRAEAARDDRARRGVRRGQRAHHQRRLNGPMRRSTS